MRLRPIEPGLCEPSNLRAPGYVTHCLADKYYLAPHSISKDLLDHLFALLLIWGICVLKRTGKFICRSSLITNTRKTRIMGINIEYLLGREEIILGDDDVRNLIHNRRILITGAAGSIGRELIQRIILFKPSQLCLLDQSEIGIHKLKSVLKDHPEVKFELASITDQIRMAFIFDEQKPQIVFHTAAYKHVSMMECFPYEAINNNLLGTQILADLSMEHQTEKFVFVSTDKAVKPLCIMGITKRLAELYIQSLHDNSSNTQFVITRFGNVLGSTGSVYPIFKNQIERGGPVTITDSEASRYFMTISEAAQLVTTAAVIGKDGEILVFDMNHPVLILDLAKRMIHSGLNHNDNIEIRFVGLGNGEKLHEDLWNDYEIKLPTSHPKISRIKPDIADFRHIKSQILILRNALKTEKTEELLFILNGILKKRETHPSFYDNLTH